MCLRPTYQHLDDFGFFPPLFSPHNGGSVIAKVSNQCDASLLWREIQSFIKGSYKVMDRGSGVGMETGVMRMLPPCYPKHEGAQVLLLQNQVESGFEMVWILEGRCGNFCSALSHAFVIQKVECGSTPMLGLAYPIHQPKWDLSYRCLTRTRKRGIWVFLCMQRWRRKPLQVLKIIGPSCSAGGNAVAEDGWNLGHGKYFCVSFVAVFQASQLVQNCCLSMTAWGSTKLFKSTSNSARSGIASIGWVPIQGQTCWNRNHSFQKNLFAICQLQLLYFCFWGKAKQKPWIFMPLCHFASYFSQDGCELSCGQRVEETSLQRATHPFSGRRWSTGFSAVSWRMATVCTVNLLRLMGKEVQRDPLDVWGLNLPSSSWSWRSLTRSLCEILHLKIAILDVFWCHMHQCHLLRLGSSKKWDLHPWASIPRQELFITGDTSQAVSRAVDFRFCDLRSLFHYFNVDPVPELDQLLINYRSHQKRLCCKLVKRWYDHVHCSWEFLDFWFSA